MEWNEGAKELLDELVKPIPVFARPMAKKKIEKYIKDVSGGEPATKEHVAKGYLDASSGNMRERAEKMLKAKGIDISSINS